MGGKYGLIKKSDLEQALAPIRTDLTLLKWMIGAVLAGIISLILRALI